VILGAHFQLRA